MRFRLWKEFLDLIFPRTCLHCGTVLYDHEPAFCTLCEGTLPRASFHFYPFENELTSKLQGLMPVNRAIAFLRFSKKGKSQLLLHKLKYRQKPEIGVELGRLFGLELLKTNYHQEWDLIVPVPLHPLKLKRRGYNQSAMFADGLSKTLNISYQEVLMRLKFTESQTQKSRLQRLENVTDVFQLASDASVAGLRILLVDDVITTGATLISCSEVLLANGAKQVDLATIAAGGK